MADYASASIRIGGTISRADVPTFIAVIEQADVWTDWEEIRFTPDDLLSGKTLSLCAHNVPWGIFRGIESFCRDHGLPYARWSGGCLGIWGPQRSVFDGASEARTFDATEDDQIVVALPDFRRLGSIEAIEDHFRAAEFVVPLLQIVDAVPSDGGGDGE